MGHILDDSFLFRLGAYAFVVVGTTIAAGLWPARGVDKPRLRQVALAVAAGVMLGAAFFHMLPEAVHAVGPEASYAVVFGFAALFVLERFVLVHACDFPSTAAPVDGGQHSRPGHCCDDPLSHERELRAVSGTLGLTVFIGLSIHTVFDGVALGSAMTSGGTGVAVLLAIVLHKVPLSFSLASVLRYEGRSTTRVLAMISVFAFLVPVGAGVFLLLAIFLEAESTIALTPWALAFSAGTFLHIAFSDVLPELHRQRAKALPMVGMILAGLAFMWGLAHFFGHSH